MPPSDREIGAHAAASSQLDQELQCGRAMAPGKEGAYETETKHTQQQQAEIKFCKHTLTGNSERLVHVLLRIRNGSGRIDTGVVTATERVSAVREA